MQLFIKNKKKLAKNIKSTIKATPHKINKIDERSNDWGKIQIFKENSNQIKKLIRL